MFLPIGVILSLGLLASPARAGDDACASIARNFVTRIEDEYPGFPLEVVGRKREAWERYKDTQLQRARGAGGEGCHAILRDLAGFFGDPHLFVFQNTTLPAAETERRRATHDAETHTAWDEAAIRAALRRGHRDPIEGIWRDGRMRLGIVRSRTGREGFEAIVLGSDTATWEPGQRRATFTRRRDGAYDGQVIERNLAHRTVVARVHRGVLLRLSPGLWGREVPVAGPDSGQVDTLDAHRATLVFRGDVPVLSIPSHDPAWRVALDRIMQAHRDTLARAPLVVLDLRGNEGGSAAVTFRLLEVVTGQRPVPLSVGADGPHVLAAPGLVDYVRARWRSVSPDSASALRLLDRMAAAPGQLVPLLDSLDAARRPAPPAPVPPELASRRIGVLVDRGTVSAAEAFVTDLVRDPRVTVFGEPTAGALDYQVVRIASIGDSTRRFAIGIPVLAARRDLPRGGMRGTGIVPNQRLDVGRVRDPIGHVIDALRR